MDDFVISLHINKKTSSKVKIEIFIDDENNVKIKQIDKNTKNVSIVSKYKLKELAIEYLDVLKDRVLKERVSILKGILNKHIIPVMGNPLVSEISRNDILKLIINLDKAPTKSTPPLALNLIKNVLDFAVDKGVLQHSPYSDSLKKRLKKYIEIPHPHVSENEIPKLISDIQNSDNYQIVLIFYKLIMLIFCRASELRLAKWEYIDFEKGIMHVPSHLMKGPKYMKEGGVLARDIMLSTQALQLLKNLHSITSGSQYLFPSITNKNVPLCHALLTRNLRLLGYKGKQDIHGFRGLASTWLNENTKGYSDIIELCLSHKNSGLIKRRYDHSKQLELQREVWQIWGDYLECQGLKTEC